MENYMAILNPYLNFAGNTEEAFNFYKSVFGGEFTMIQRFKDTPEKDKISPADQQKIMHVGLPIGKGNVLMATDALESMGHPVKMGNNINLSLETQNKEESDKIFNALSVGGKIEMPLQNTFWGAYFGSVIDKFEIHWLVNYTLPK
jgi:PhnB protein